MNELTAADRALLGPPNFAWIVTLNADGSPQATLTWVGANETHVLVNTAVGRKKDRNVERDPHVTVAVQQHGDAYRWISIEGVVERRELGSRRRGPHRRTGARLRRRGVDAGRGPAPRALARPPDPHHPVRGVATAA